MLKARIIGTGSYLPGKILTNHDLARKVPDKSEENKRGFDIQDCRQKLSRENVNISNITREDLFDNWAQRLSGIEKRCIYSPSFLEYEKSTEVMASIAAIRALDHAKLKGKDLDMIILSSFTQGWDVPNPAATVGNEIGAEEYESLTISTACTGFIQGIILAERAIRLGNHKNVLVVASETLSKVTNYNDAKTAVLFGDGAGAVVLTADQTGILGTVARTQYAENILFKRDIGYLEMEGGREVMKKAVRLMAKAAKESLEIAGLSIDDMKYSIPHQANMRILRGYGGTSGINTGEERIVNTIRNFGNTSAASVGIAFDKAVKGEVENCRINKGDILTMTALGGGLVYAGVALEF